MENGIWVKDVYGNEVLTNEGFNRMRQQMELYINSFPNINVINTTKGGAHIEGTSFVELEDIIDKDLKEKQVEENWLEGNKTNYDKEHLKSQSEKMDRAYKRALKLIDEYYEVLNIIESLLKNRNFDQVEKMYVKLDKVFGNIERNDFFKIFILPMNRVYHKLLADSTSTLKEERNPIEKGIRILNSYRGFMRMCKKEIDELEEVYEEMKEGIKSYEG